MKTIGFDQPIHILPCDHRGAFQTRMFGWHGDLNDEQTARIAAIKQVIYDGFKAAVTAGVPRDSAVLLVDEQFGGAILRDARANGYRIACPVGKHGSREFDFEFGSEFAQHIEALRPAFCKVLVRYNPEGDAAMNRRQAARLRQLSEYLHDRSPSRYLVELLVPPEPAQLERVAGDEEAYDAGLRPQLMAQAIRELQDAGVEPDAWKIAGLDRREDCETVVAAVQAGGRGEVGCILHCLGEVHRWVIEWLTTAARVRGFIGLAVGQSVYWDSCMKYRDRRITRETAVAEIAGRYREFVDVFEGARALSQA